MVLLKEAWHQLYIETSRYCTVYTISVAFVLTLMQINREFEAKNEVSEG